METKLCNQAKWEWCWKGMVEDGRYKNTKILKEVKKNVEKF